MKHHIKIEVQDWANWVNKHYQNPDMRTAIDELTLKSDSSEMVNVDTFKNSKAFDQCISNWIIQNR